MRLSVWNDIYYKIKNGVIMMTVLERISQLRAERGWAEYRLSEEAGISQSTISTWYRQNMIPTIPSLEKICEGFNISMSEFFSYDGSPFALTEDQKELIKNWDRLNPLQQKAIIKLMQTM